MVETALQPIQVTEGIERPCGSWRVTWRADDFLIPDVGYFSFKRIVLPIEIVITDESRVTGYATVRLESGFRFALLHGAPFRELEDFKRRASAGVLAASGSPYFCSECGHDAAMRPFAWNGDVCPGCRDSFCRNPNCLRRLGVDDQQDGTRVCKGCHLQGA